MAKGDEFSAMGRYINVAAGSPTSCLTDFPAKQPASGMVPGNISVTGSLIAPESTISPALPGDVTGTTTEMITQPPVS